MNKKTATEDFVDMQNVFIFSFGFCPHLWGAMIGFYDRTMTRIGLFFSAIDITPHILLQFKYSDLTVTFQEEV